MTACKGREIMGVAMLERMNGGGKNCGIFPLSNFWAQKGIQMQNGGTSFVLISHLRYRYHIFFL